ncbi:uncharacterized protein V1510DRAFT_411462, partial [Dipodascopsis tothii]|uniref:uncharacterized protein n=1 Tax=Dipodascopsis tothii TaxID=44089 RepID=UPI0034CFCAE9
MLSIPSLLTSDAHGLWYSESTSSHVLQAPAPAARRGAAETETDDELYTQILVHNHGYRQQLQQQQESYAAQAAARSRAGLANGTMPPSSGWSLDHAEAVHEKYLTLIRQFGYSFIRPTGFTKTMQADLEEQSVSDDVSDEESPLALENDADADANATAVTDDVVDEDAEDAEPADGYSDGETDDAAELHPHARRARRLPAEQDLDDDIPEAGSFRDSYYEEGDDDEALSEPAEAVDEYYGEYYSGDDIEADEADEADEAVAGDRPRPAYGQSFDRPAYYEISLDEAPVAADASYSVEMDENGSMEIDESD